MSDWFLLNVMVTVLLVILPLLMVIMFKDPAEDYNNHNKHKFKFLIVGLSFWFCIFSWVLYLCCYLLGVGGMYG